MAALTTIALVGAAAVGAAATVHSVNQQRKAAKKQAAQIKKSREQQITEAKERAKVDAARDETGAVIQLGRDRASRAATGTAAGAGAGTNRQGSVSARVGGVAPQQSAGMPRRQASAGL